MPTSEQMNAKPIPEHIVEQLVDFCRALRTGQNTPPEDAKHYADLEIEFDSRREK